MSAKIAKCKLTANGRHVWVHINNFWSVISNGYTTTRTKYGRYTCACGLTKEGAAK